MSNETREINVEKEMLTPVNKLEALSQLFDCAADSDLSRMDLSGILGIKGFLRSIANEILGIAEGLNERIADIQEKEATNA